MFQIISKFEINTLNGFEYKLRTKKKADDPIEQETDRIGKTVVTINLHTALRVEPAEVCRESYALHKYAKNCKSSFTSDAPHKLYLKMKQETGPLTRNKIRS